jgi:hypothetical protein
MPGCSRLATQQNNTLAVVPSTAQLPPGNSSSGVCRHAACRWCMRENSHGCITYAGMLRLHLLSCSCRWIVCGWCKLRAQHVCSGASIRFNQQRSTEAPWTWTVILSSYAWLQRALVQSCSYIHTGTSLVAQVVRMLAAVTGYAEGSGCRTG